VTQKRHYFAMRQIYGGAILVIAGIAALIEAYSHKPAMAPAFPRIYTSAGGTDEITVAVPSGGLSQTAYDLLRIGAWALVILGAVTLVLGLILYWQRPRSAV
jgi:uncharacterized membrane protein HdeD (DUF308 family)